MDSATATTALSQFVLADWLKKAVDKDASDAHFHSKYPPLFRINGSFVAMEGGAVSEASLKEQVFKLLNDEERATFEANKDADFTYEIERVARFRGSVFLSHTGLNANFRILPPEPSSLDDLGLPSALKRFTSFHHGLVLVTGPAGCGKSTTLAALVNLINENHTGDHILTLEDPIEIIHKNKACIINQRQVPLHSESYARAMRAALREDPDVIVIGEMRDAETIALALTAAETGHLVIASMHTTDAIRSITRIIDAFPPEKEAQIRTMLSESLQGVFSQLLLPSADGKSRVVAYELLFVSSAVGNLIRDKKTFQIPSVMQLGRAQGMITLDQCIRDLLREQKITKETAARYIDPAMLQ